MAADKNTTNHKNLVGLVGMQRGRDEERKEMTNLEVVDGAVGGGRRWPRARWGRKGHQRNVDLKIKDTKAFRTILFCSTSSGLDGLIDLFGLPHSKWFNEKLILRTSRIEPWAAGWELRKLLLCYAAPWIKNNPWKPFLARSRLHLAVMVSCVLLPSPKHPLFANLIYSKVN